MSTIGEPHDAEVEALRRAVTVRSCEQVRGTIGRTRSMAAFVPNRLDLAWSPLLREERFERGVQAQDDGPTLAGYGLNPFHAAHPAAAWDRSRRSSNRRRSIRPPVTDIFDCPHGASWHV